MTCERTFWILGCASWRRRRRANWDAAWTAGVSDGWNDARFLAKDEEGGLRGGVECECATCSAVGRGSSQRAVDGRAKARFLGTLENDEGATG